MNLNFKGLKKYDVIFATSAAKMYKPFQASSAFIGVGVSMSSLTKLRSFGRLDSSNTVTWKYAYRSFLISISPFVSLIHKNSL